MAQNIFQIWAANGKKTPFAVRRDNWDSQFFTVVEKVVVRKMPYGTAYGYPTEDGVFNSHYEYDEKWREERIIPSAGCYQWELADDVDVSNLSPIKPES